MLYDIAKHMAHVLGETFIYIYVYILKTKNTKTGAIAEVQRAQPPGMQGESGEAPRPQVGCSDPKLFTEVADPW